MGEIADYMVDQMLFGGHRHGAPTRGGKIVICKHCGATGLFWGKFRGEWVLRNADTSDHVCAPTTEGFENFDK